MIVIDAQDMTYEQVLIAVKSNMDSPGPIFVTGTPKQGSLDELRHVAQMLNPRISGANPDG